jgi:hypothetical protein
MSYGIILKTDKEIEERKSEIKKREMERKSPEETRKDLMKTLRKKNSLINNIIDYICSFQISKRTKNKASTQ